MQPVAHVLVPSLDFHGTELTTWKAWRGLLDQAATVAAEQRDELAPSHVLPQAEGHTLPPFIETVLCITANFGRR